ncbi:MAG: hypothetical protein JJT94_00825 [Bernardetiaceae bacterium]|nr:hypothetical protein [Bernardetiaceae bacterium]
MRFYLFVLLCFLFAGWKNVGLVYGQTIQGQVSINDGASFTNEAQGRVLLKLYATGAAEMRVSNDPSFVGARWTSYSPRREHRLDAREDGIKTVYVQFRDASASVYSEVAVAQIELDRVPPENPTIMVNYGNKRTNLPENKVPIAVSATDAREMRISTRSDFYQGRWYPYRENIPEYPISTSDGAKIIYAQFRDAAGNISETVADTIYVDRSAPTDNSIKINDGQRYTNNRQVTLNLRSKGADKVYIRGLPEPVPYAPEITYTLPDSQGLQVIMAVFIDEVGNKSRPVYSEIILDMTPPLSPKMVIDGNNRYTRNPRTRIRFSAIGAKEMKVGNESDLSDAKWEKYQYVILWKIKEGDGPKTVYAQFRDAAGNETEIVSDDIILDQTPPKNPKITLIAKEGEGLQYTGNRDALVDIELDVEGDARYMMLARTNSFYDGRWEYYQDQVKNFDLGKDSEDGVRTVYVRFRDKAGNLSETASASIYLDREPPVGQKVMINKDDEYTNDPDGNVTLYLDAKGASEVLVGNDTLFRDSEWYSMRPMVKWQLPGEDGLKRVAVKYRDKAGNVSDVVFDEIILDRKPPYDCYIAINHGDSITNNPDRVVVINVKAKDAYQMQIDNTPQFKHAPWQNYDEKNINYRLPDPDGYKTVYARFRDKAGNISETISATIKLDRTPPIIGKVLLNDGDNGTRFQKVKLELEARGAVKMMIANSHLFRDAQWEPYKTTRDWTLVDEDGIKIVFVKFKDEAGNESEVAYAQIGLFRQPPENGKIIVNKGELYVRNINKYVNIYLQSKGATKMRISTDDPEFKNSEWIKYQPYFNNYVIPGEDGEKTIYAQFSDDVGNLSEPISTKVIVDRQPPYNEELYINGGEPFTNKREVELMIIAEEADEMIISPSRSFTNPAKWEPYAESKKWVLIGQDGYKTVYIKFRDKAGNESFVTSAQILLDTQPPAPGRVLVNGGETIINDNKVKLYLSASADAKFMMISNSIKFDDGAYWQEYKDRIDWVLPPGHGYKRIYIKFKDLVGNESQPIFCEVNLEQ